MRRVALSSLSAAALLAPLPALAQAYQCRLPARISAPRAVVPDEPRRVRPVAGYLLALSWSPEFCRSRAAEPRHARQCSGSGGRFGFVLHGLWPEAAGPDYPRWCARSPALPAALVRAQLCRTPSEALVAHEWAKHGTCSPFTPARYFKVAGDLYDSLAFPDLDALSRRQPDAGAIRTAFRAANPGWPAAAIGIHLSRSGWLREVRLCMNRALRPQRCPAHARGAPDRTPVQIWRGLGGAQRVGPASTSSGARAR